MLQSHRIAYGNCYLAGFQQNRVCKLQGFKIAVIHLDHRNIG